MRTKPEIGVLAVLLAAVVAAFGCGGDTRPAASPTAAICGGETREPLNCDSEVAYQGTDVSGGLDLIGLGKASGDVEQKALREIDAQTELYIAQTRRLCDEYNKCVLDRETYATRSENLRRRVAKVPELLDAVKSAGTEDERRAALAKAYRELVPEETRTELRLEFSTLAEIPGASAMLPVPALTRLPSGSRVAFMVKLSHPAYVYLFQRPASGNVAVLFPDARIDLPNPIPAGVSLRIPAGDASFRLDDQDIGTEAVYLVASLRPITALATAAQRIASGQPAGSEAIVDRVTAIDKNCNARGFSLETEPSTGCVRSRGLVLDGGGPGGASKASLSAATEAADDLIATVFRFEHVR